MAYLSEMGTVDSGFPNEYPTPAAPAYTSVKRRGLFFRFTMFVLKLGLVCFVVLVLIAWRLWTMIAASEPQALPPLKLDAAQQAALKQRCERYMLLLNSGKNPGPIAFNADELNAFIDGDRNLHGRLRVEMPNDCLFAHVAIQYDPRPRKGDLLGDALRGKWLNASAAFSISLVNNDFSVRIERLILDGWTIPSIITSRVANQNLADMLSRSDRQELARKFENVSIRDGKLVLTPKTKLAMPARPAAVRN